MTKLNLKKYENMYNNFDGGHNRKHCFLVRKMAIKLAKRYLPNKLELVYIAATLHDIGISVSRENHESDGEKLIRQDDYLKQNLSEEDLEEICHAVREHRASTGKPRTILAKIISDADRSCDSSSKALIRAFNYGLEKFPELNEEEQILRSAKHLSKKYHIDGYGRRTYFIETRNLLEKTYNPIIEAYQKQDLKFLKSLMSNLLK